MLTSRTRIFYKSLISVVYNDIDDFGPLQNKGSRVRLTEKVMVCIYVCWYVLIYSASKPQKIVQFTEDNNMTSSGSDFNYPQILTVCKVYEEGIKLFIDQKRLQKCIYMCLRKKKLMR